MRCPFLSEAEVCYCSAFPLRKLPASADSTATEGKCASRQFVACPLLADRPEAGSDARSCPLLCKSQDQFCAASPVPHFIPYNAGLLSCCQSQGHRYCDQFLSRLQVDQTAGGAEEEAGAEDVARVNGIDLPAHLSFAANHMWIDISEDGSCHVGADDFLAKAVGAVESVTFVPCQSDCRPTAVLHACGVDLPLTFPQKVHVSRSNVHLRRDPSKVTSQPYGRGWLFEGRIDGLLSYPDGSPASLRRGDEALAWMTSETERMTRFMHEILSHVGPDGDRLRDGGGTLSSPVIAHLTPQDRVLFVNTFFALDRAKAAT
jgi:glycine cleavage system H lipoate-binding protein